MKRKLYSIKEKSRYGECISCSIMTSERNRFSDDPDDTYGYEDWCHDICYEHLLSKV